MRKILVFLIASYLSLDTYAGGKWGSDSVTCITNLSLYREYYKQKNYKDAFVVSRSGTENISSKNAVDLKEMNSCILIISFPRSVHGCYL